MSSSRGLEEYPYGSLMGVSPSPVYPSMRGFDHILLALRGDCDSSRPVTMVGNGALDLRHVRALLADEGFHCETGHGERAIFSHLTRDKRLNVIVSSVKAREEGEHFAHDVVDVVGKRRDLTFLFLNEGPHGETAQAPHTKGEHAMHGVHFLSPPFGRSVIVKNVYIACYELELARRLRERLHLERIFRDFSRHFFRNLQAAVTDGRDERHSAESDFAETAQTVEERSPSDKRQRMLYLSRRLLRAKEKFENIADMGDACLKMLLELYDASLVGKKVKVTALCYLSGAAQTTALRHIDSMVAAGIVSRHQDKNDKRRVFLALSHRGKADVEGYLDDLWRQHQSMAS
ncbi:MAG: hypothetical protein GDA54_02375 [Alphaproteobacteria bacterium GM7ARS4]|nr:hypothetical protein [Alphaproteobacteria bacterium GM7ARS4]